ncbi:NAD-dependent epimerase/dehydratase family protein [Isoptericola aurantiacus]|uniref:NAD-dependent epimerase/dehydratase family protein n=1 Tax=Isoptericola aurantiacus TaxID=3377839 RepID=UPI00383A2121
MHIFMTGASGWIGSAVVDELLGAGYTVTGLARSATTARAMERQGVTALHGDLDDPDSLRQGASRADAVVHLANKHDWAHPDVMNRAERNAVRTLGDALAATDRAFLVASALAGVRSDGVATEDDPSPAVGLDSMRGGSENLALDYSERDVRAMAVRFAPSVHGPGDPGFVAALVRAAHAHGFSAYPDEGSNTWSAVHRADAARLIRLSIETAPAGSRLHAVGEESVSTRTIAEAIAARYSLSSSSIPSEDAVAHFGSVGRFFTQTIHANSTRTENLLGWAPTHSTLEADIHDGAYDSA